MKAVGLLFIVGRGLEMVELEGNNKRFLAMPSLFLWTKACPYPYLLLALPSAWEFSHMLCYDERRYIILNWDQSD